MLEIKASTMVCQNYIKVSLIHWYWVLRLSELQTGQNLQHAYDTIAMALPHLIDTTMPISQNLNKSWKAFREIKQKAVQKCKDFLQSLIMAAPIAGDKPKGKLIQHHLHAKQNYQWFAITKKHLKPRMLGG